MTKEDAALIRQAVGLGCRQPTYGRDLYPIAFAAWATRARAVVTNRFSPDLKNLVAKADLYSGFAIEAQDRTAQDPKAENTL